MFSTEASVLSAFHGGALKTLVIHNLHESSVNWSTRPAEQSSLFHSVNLLGLTSLELHIRNSSATTPPRVMAALATASLPLLSKLAVLGGALEYTLAEGDVHLLSGFTQLRSLSLTKLKMEESDWAWVLVNILPRIEEFGTSEKAFITSIQALETSTASWPLQKLTLESFGVLDILSLASQFPSITTLSLHVSKDWCMAFNPQLGESTAHEAIINAAVNERAWPDLTSLSFSPTDPYFYKCYLSDKAVLERAWPRATIQATIKGR